MAEDIIELKVDKSQVEDATKSIEQFRGEVDKTITSTRGQRSEVNGMWREFRAGSELAVGSLRGLREAVLATGIGALVIAAGALFEIMKKFDLFKDLWHGITDAIGMTTYAQDALDKAQRQYNEAAIAGLNNELTLLKAKGASMDDIFQKELQKAAATFETEKATLLAYASSEKNFELAAKGGEQDVKMQNARTAYFALLATQQKTQYDNDTKYTNETRLLKEKDLKKSLDEIEIWYTAESKKYPTDYALYLLYEEKKKKVREDYSEKAQKENLRWVEQFEKDWEKGQAEVSVSNLKWIEKFEEDWDKGRAKDSEDNLKWVERFEQDWEKGEEEGAKLRKESRQTTLSESITLLDNLSSMSKQGSIEQKALATGAAIINTYQAATKALTLPVPFNWIEEALVIAEGLANVAKIEGVKFERGGYINGPSHANGGVPILAEGGEVMMSNSAVSRNPAIASMVLNANRNALGGSSAPSLGASEIAKIAAQVTKSIPVNINETDRMIEQRRIQVRENIFTI